MFGAQRSQGCFPFVEPWKWRSSSATPDEVVTILCLGFLGRGKLAVQNMIRVQSNHCLVLPG